jgi:hypothetical protein
MSKVVTGKSELVQFSYCNLFKSRAFSDDQKAKYSMCVLVPKKYTKTLQKLQAGIDDAIRDGQEKFHWSDKQVKALRLPVRDGDEEKADEHPEYAGMYFFNASSDTKPDVVDADMVEVIDSDEVYSGCWGRVSVTFYPYDNHGNRGIGAGLNNVQKIKDGERLGGTRASAESDFGGDDDDEEF